MQPISIDQELAKKLDQGMRGGDNVELPFPVIYIWALNGQASYKSQGGALYYGGWAAKAEDVQALAEQSGLVVPSDWKLSTIASRDGGEFDAYTMRSILCAPIARRESWLVDGRRAPHYVEGGRRHLQCLVYLAEKTGVNGAAKFIPWSPVVLTAKGYQAKNLTQAFTTWDKTTAGARYKIARGAPAWCFYLSVGTFGKERQAVNVGKPGAQSPITPIMPYLPEKLSEELVVSLFVGNEVMALMADYQDQAKAWLEAWKQPEAQANGQEDEFLVPQDGGNDVDIPF